MRAHRILSLVEVVCVPDVVSQPRRARKIASPLSERRFFSLSTRCDMGGGSLERSTFWSSSADLSRSIRAVVSVLSPAECACRWSGMGASSGVQRLVFLQRSESTECYEPTRRQHRQSGLYTRSANSYCHRPYMMIESTAADTGRPAPTLYPGYNLSEQSDCYSELTDGRLF